jgi:hypothetical protein
MWLFSAPATAPQNRRRRGHRTWGKEIDIRYQREQQELRRRRGKGSWGTETANLYREGRRRERQERRSRSLLYRLLG